MTDWSAKKVLQLRSELKRRGLPQTGLKGELVSRLRESERIGSPDEEDTINLPFNRGAQIARQPAPTQTQLEPAETVANLPVEDVAPQEETNEGEAAPLTIAESETPAIEDGPKEDEQLPEETETSGQGTAQPSSAVVEADEPKLSETTPVDEVMEEIKEKPESSKEADISPSNIANTSSPESQETQKRKRRSLTPPPTEESIARKRARLEEETNGSGPNTDLFVGESPTRIELREDEMKVDEKTLDKPSHIETFEPHEKRDPTPIEPQDMMDIERDVVPSVHPATPALYIKNFMRPLRPNDVQAYLVDLATPSNVNVDDTIITDFFLDQIRTHAFVAFKSTSAASRVRAALHENVWPNESNRKPLWVDFIPPEKVQEWIDKEESNVRRFGPRWEVIYENGPDGEIEAVHVSDTASLSRAGRPPPPGPPVSNADALPPTGPRSTRDNAPPRGPRADRSGPGPSSRPQRSVGGDYKSTQAEPVIYYQPVPEDLANRRIQNMHSYYTKDLDRDLGREINRFSFEDGDSFVDRGKEIFEGIRPPHRERAVQRERRGFGMGRGGPNGPGGGRRRRQRGFRPGRDRYHPEPRGDPRGGPRGGRDDFQRSGNGRESFRRREDRDRRY